MLTTIIYIILAAVISFLVTLDASPATLFIGTATLFEIPLFFIVFASMIVGMFLASGTTIKNLIESKLTIFGKNKDLKKSYKTSDDLLLKVNKLEEENSVLKDKINELNHPKKVVEKI